MSRSLPQRQRRQRRPPGHDSLDPSAFGARDNSRALTSVPLISGLTVLPIRLFMGMTFIYAGLQKITDPGFFQRGARTSIWAQILSYSQGSPIRGLLMHFYEHAALIGWLTILTEMSIGALVLIGLFTRPAALIGLSVNFMFFLSASWHTYPYFFGSDIVFVVLWMSVALTGAGAYALDALAQPIVVRELRARLNPRESRFLASLLVGPLRPDVTPEGYDAPTGAPGLDRAVRITRGEVLLGSLASLGLIVAALLPRGSSSAASGKLAAGKGTTGTSGSPARSGSAGAPAGMHRIGNISQLPPNSAGMVNDPKSGDPAIVIHTSGSSYYAYDAVCTHAGCTVQWDPQQKLIVCPCHGGAYDATKGAQVVAGPPPSPLTVVPMKIDAKGDIYIE